MPSEDGPGEDRGLLWLNLIGWSVVFVLLAVFFIFYGPRFWEFVTGLFGSRDAAEQWMKQ